MLRILFVSVITFVIFIVSFSEKTATDWPEYNGDGARSHYSALSQISRKNVKNLKVAWTYHSGGADTIRHRTQMQCNPIIIKGVLYGVSAETQAFALDAITGKQLWKTEFSEHESTTSRGVSYWSDGKTARIFMGAGKWLYALDAVSGKPVSEFGTAGRINLKTGLERPGADDYVSSNTPNTIYENLIITGVRVAESESALLGDIRAFDARTGKLIWTFKTIPDKGEEGYESWYPENPRQNLGGANAWMGMAVDREAGIVYVPTGSAAYDFYGGNRHGDNLFANCLLALDARTGKKIWHYQLVHHDIWDRDPPAPPNLLEIVRNGKKVKAVALVTKQGQTFVFNRLTGEPVYPINQMPFPQESMPGEKVSITQPVPSLPVPFTRQSFTSQDFSPFVADKDSLIAILSKARTGSPYIPVTEKMTVFFPGTDGGAQWGGAAADPEGILYVPAKEIPVYTSLVPRKQATARISGGQKLYGLYCSSCHGEDRKGSHDGSYPGLSGIAQRLSAEQLHTLLQNGQGRMPSFSHLSVNEKKLLTGFLFDKISDETIIAEEKPLIIPYQHTGYNRWYDRNGYPVSMPPWGTLTAIDLNTGQHKWQVPLGEYAALTKEGIPPTGTDNYGGPLVTAGGLVFIAATRDEKFRAFDKETGKLLWESDLPAAGYATPSTYAVNGKQYVVIACGGGKLNTRSGDQYVAFALE